MVMRLWDHIKMSSETALMKTPAVNIQEKKQSWVSESQKLL